MNTIDKIPEVDVEVDVEQFKYKEISSQTIRLVENSISNTTNDKAVFFFNSRNRLCQVFEAV